MGKHIKLSHEDQTKIEAFIKRKHVEKGDAFDDALVAADVSIENLLPGQEITGEYVKKVRKQLGIKLPRGNRFTGKKKAGRQAKAKDVAQASREAINGTVEILEMAIDRLKAQKIKIDEAIAATETAILAAQGIL